jgi:hypothetical protein
VETGLRVGVRIVLQGRGNVAAGRYHLDGVGAWVIEVTNRKQNSREKMIKKWRE